MGSLAAERRVRVHVRLLGVTSALELPRALVGALREALPPGAGLVVGAAGGAAGLIEREADLDAAVSMVELDAARRAPGLIVIHAAVVVLDGAALLLPGRSGVGKSTLAAALVARGATYFSDEFAPLTSDGRVLAYPRPLRLRPAPGRAPRTVGPASGSVRRGGGAPPPEPVPVTGVAALRHVRDARSELRAAGPAGTVLSLIDNAVGARTRTAEALRTCSLATESARGWEGERGEAGPTADLLLDLLR